MFSDSEIVKYSGKPIRDIKLNELLTLFDLKTKWDKCDFLNTTIYKWNVEEVNSYNEEIFSNNFKNISILIKDKNTIYYLHNRLDDKLFRNELIENGFKGGEGYYTNKKFEIIIGRKMNDIETTIKSFKPITFYTIVTITKK